LSRETTNIKGKTSNIMSTETMVEKQCSYGNTNFQSGDTNSAGHEIKFVIDPKAKYLQYSDDSFIKAKFYTERILAFWSSLTLFVIPFQSPATCRMFFHDT